MAKNDFVVIDSSLFNTYAATKGMPVGQRITSLTGQQVVGKILTVPEFEALDYNPYIATWDEQLETEHYRTAEVIWYGINSIVVAHLQSGSITPGNTSLVTDSIETDKRVDGKLALRPGDDGDLISFHAGSAGDDIRIGIMGRVNVQTVSYTHLRAHETVLDLVCRLLLEKKKEHNTQSHTHSHHL